MNNTTILLGSVWFNGLSLHAMSCDQNHIENVQGFLPFEDHQQVNDTVTQFKVRLLIMF